MGAVGEEGRWIAGIGGSLEGQLCRACIGVDGGLGLGRLAVLGAVWWVLFYQLFGLLWLGFLLMGVPLDLFSRVCRVRLSDV